LLALARPVLLDMGSHFSPRALQSPTVLLSHGHLDHSSGLVSWVHQRSLAAGNRNRKRHSIVYCPVESVEALERVFECAQAFRPTRPLGVQVCGVSAANFFGPVSGSLYVRPFVTTHRIASLGFTLLQRNKKLKACYQGLEGRELGRLRREGTAIEDEHIVPVLAYTGDTTLEPVLKCEEALTCALLILECTYLDDSREISCAQERGHIHLDEVIRNADAFVNTGHLLFMHISQIYSNREVERIFLEKLPACLRNKSSVLLPCAADMTEEPATGEE